MAKGKRGNNSKLNHKQERIEALIRIPVAIVSSIILSIWSYLTGLLILINWFMTLILGERNRTLALFCEYWNTEIYKFARYMTFMSNRRPFPFSRIEWISKFE